MRPETYKNRLHLATAIFVTVVVAQLAMVVISVIGAVYMILDDRGTGFTLFGVCWVILCWMFLIQHIAYQITPELDTWRQAGRPRWP